RGRRGERLRHRRARPRRPCRAGPARRCRRGAERLPGGRPRARRGLRDCPPLRRRRHRPRGSRGPRRVRLRSAVTRPPLPRWLLVAAVLAVLLAALPLAGLAARVPWARVPELLASEAARDALLLSLRTCALS